MLYLTALLPGLVIPLAALTALGMSLSLRREYLADLGLFRYLGGASITLAVSIEPVLSAVGRRRWFGFFFAV